MEKIKTTKDQGSKQAEALKVLKPAGKKKSIKDKNEMQNLKIGRMVKTEDLV